MQSDSSIMQLVSPVILMRSRLYEPGLQAKDVGGAGDCFFRSVSHQLHVNNNHHHSKIKPPDFLISYVVKHMHNT